MGDDSGLEFFVMQEGLSALDEVWSWDLWQKKVNMYICSHA
jgi:hypothetical protein